MKWLVLAILIHVTSEIFGLFYALNEEQSYNIYSTGIALSMLCWGIGYKYKKETYKTQLISGVWIWFLASSVLQEISKTIGVFQSFFGDPTKIYPTMIAAFIIAAGYVIWKLKFATFRK